MIKDIAIVGNSGFAKEVKWIIDRINEVKPTWNFLGYIDNESKEAWHNDDYIINNYTKPLSIAFAIGNCQLREKLVNTYKENHNLSFPNLIDPSVLIGNSNTFGVGNIICANTIITVNVNFGNFAIVNLSSSIGHESKFGDYITLNPSVNISGNVKLGNRVFVGVGTQILQGLTIGQNTVIGAGAVVINDLPENVTAVGIPAKIIKRHLNE